MSLQDVITALAEHWDETVRHLGPRDRQLVADSIRRIAEAPGGPQAARAAADLTTILAARLPPGHPVLEVISSGSRLAGGVTDWSRIAEILRARPDAGGGLPDLSAPAPRGAAGARGASEARDAAAPAAETRLLAAPALTAPEVREHGGNPDHDDLIRLPPPSGAVRLPAFQFGADGRPVAVVLTINRMLDAAADPWGVADWWLGRNAWLDGTPADLLGHVDDALLVAAARAEFPEQ